MLATVARHAPSIIAGSALAGFGLSLGRDVYRKGKERWPLIVVLLCLVGVFFASRWMFRNYRTATGSILKKLGALFVLSGLGIVFYFTSVYAVPLVLIQINVSITSEDSLFHGSILYGVLFLVGAIVGVKHRKKRRLAWEAEAHNSTFLEEHGLETVDVDDKGNLRLRDNVNGIGYRLSDDLDVTGELEFMALGRRNKRAYIRYDEAGRFTSWSGLVDDY